MIKNQFRLIVSVLLLSSITINSSQAQDLDVPEKNKTLLMKLTADWCGPCGGIGWDWFDSFAHEYETDKLNAIPVALHTTSTHNSSLNYLGKNYILGNFDKPLFGLPSFGISHKLEVGSKNDMRAEIEHQTKGPVVVNSGFITRIVGDSMKVRTLTKFFSPSSGEHYVSIHLYEDGIISYQDSRSDSAVHNRIMRCIPKTEWESVFGKRIPGTSFQAGDLFEDSTSIYLPKEWNRNNLHVYIVTWKRVGNQNVVANANDIPTYPLDVELVHKAEPPHVILSPNPATDIVTLQISNTYYQNISISVTDINGRVIYSQNDIEHTTNLNINTSTFTSGVYHISVTAGSRTTTERLVISR